MALLPGAKLGPYEVLAPLGAGGMGEVYRARDPRLGREVAIKVLPAERMADEERRRRFIREARAASALNHPGIVTIHEIESADGADFIVMELVQGKTLDALIPRQGMRLGEALRIAIPVADALARAHAAGIVHRDLKPANVMVTPEGAVKVLDFGLAKLTQADGESELPEASTLDGPQPPLSQAGAVAGTPGYMSPEQAIGGKVDGRSDVFGFGAVLYEMMTGRRAFAGASAADTLVAVLREQPRPPSEVVPGLPKEVDRLILRCLRKDPERRFQDMLDVKVELQELKEESDSAAATPAARAGRRRLRLAGVAFGVLLLLAAGWALYARRGHAPLPPRLVALTSTPGWESSPTFSPDGSQVAFVWDGEKPGNLDIWLTMVGGAEARRLTTDPGIDLAPSWSPDGLQIAFVRVPFGKVVGAIYVVSPLGASERKLSSFPVAGAQPSWSPTHPSWSPDGRLLTGGSSQLSWSPDGRFLAAARAAPVDEAQTGTRGIYLIPVEGGEPRALTSPPAGGHDTFPALSADGRRLAWGACLGRACDIQVMELGAGLTPRGPPRRLTQQGLRPLGLAWTRDGQSLVYGACLPTACHLWRVSAAADRPPEKIELAGLRASSPATVASRDRLVFARDFSDLDIHRFHPGRPSEAVLASSFWDYSPSFSPDGARVAFSSGRTGEAQEIWLAGADGSNPVQLTHGPGQHQGWPRFSPDGRRLVFNSQGPDGHWDVWTIDADGGQAQRLTEDPGDEQTPSWSHDGRWVYFTSGRGREEGWDVWRVPAAGGPAERLTHTSAAAVQEAADRRSLLIMPRATEGPLVSVPLGGGPERQLVPCVRHWGFHVGPEGIHYAACASGQPESPLRLLDPATGRDRLLGKIETGRGLFLGLAASPDGKTVLFSRWVGEGADLMIIENFR